MKDHTIIQGGGPRAQDPELHREQTIPSCRGGRGPGDLVSYIYIYMYHTVGCLFCLCVCVCVLALAHRLASCLASMLSVDDQPEQRRLQR